MPDKEKKTRTPRSAEAIVNGAHALPLVDRIALCKALKISIDEEVSKIKAEAEKAISLQSSLNGTK